MQFDILTIFPEIINEYCAQSILGRAQKSKKIKIKAHNFRAYTKDKHGHVDDRPYGGGPGMVLQIQPIYDCLKKIKALSPNVILSKAKDPLNRKLRDSSATPQNDKWCKTKVIILDPAGKKFDQRLAEKYAQLDRLVLICGRYEGFDARIYKLADERVSVGDYVLAGGELPALMIVEAVSRLVPGVLGNSESLKEETFSKFQNPNHKFQIKSKSQIPKVRTLGFDAWNLEFAGEYPQYTRPENFEGLKVPKVLLSGDHKKIEVWRQKKS